jgi:hypothetical protein
VAQFPGSATASNEETREVLSLATAALEDPRCDAAALRVASYLHHEFNDGEPVTLESYRAAVKRYAVSTPLLNEDVFRKARAIALLLLKFKQLDYSRASAGKPVLYVNLASFLPDPQRTQGAPQRTQRTCRTPQHRRDPGRQPLFRDRVTRCCV